MEYLGNKNENFIKLIYSFYFQPIKEKMDLNIMTK